MAERLQFLSLLPVGFQFRFVEFCPLPDQFARGRGVDAPHEDLSGKIECCWLALVLSMEMSRRMVVKEHSDDDSEERRDDRHRRMLTDEICDGLTGLSLSCERPSHASVPDALELAKHEGLQARASVRPLDGCSEKLGAPFVRCRCSSEKPSNTQVFVELRPVDVLTVTD